MFFTLSQTSPGFNMSVVQLFWKTLGTEEILHNEQFLLFPQCFYLFGELSAIFIKLKLLSANSFILEDFEICCLEKS